MTPVIQATILQLKLIYSVVQRYPPWSVEVTRYQYKLKQERLTISTDTKIYDLIVIANETYLFP